MFNAKRFSELLKTAIGANRSITDFSKDCKVVRPYISKFVNCKLDKAPSPEVIRKFASAAANGVDEVDLLGAAGYLKEADIITMTYGWVPTDPLHPFSCDYKESDSLKQLRNKLNLQYNQDNDIVQPTPFRVPILSFIDPETIISLEKENVIGYDYIPSSNKYDVSKCFYLVANDKSMINARIHEGDKALIVPDKPYQHNDIVLILKDGESFLRKYKKLNGIHTFYAGNDEFDSFAVTNTELKKSTITIIGTVEKILITL